MFVFQNEMNEVTIFINTNVYASFFKTGILLNTQFYIIEILGSGYFLCIIL